MKAADRRAVPATRVWNRHTRSDRRVFRNRPGVEMMRTSAGQGDGSPFPFYERYGFEQTGDIVFNDEVLLRLQLR